jgi:hypothetical protein
MKSWEINAAEYVELVVKSGLPTSECYRFPTVEDVGQVAFCQLSDVDDPTKIDELGIIVHCAPKGKRVRLVGTKKIKGKVQRHEDGEYGQVYVASYMRRKWRPQPKKNLKQLKSSFAKTVLFFFFFFDCLFMY